MEATNQVSSSNFSTTLNAAQNTSATEQQQQEQEQILAELETVIQQVAQEVAEAKSGDGTAAAQAILSKSSHGTAGIEQSPSLQLAAQVANPITQIQEANRRFLDSARS